MTTSPRGLGKFMVATKDGAHWLVTSRHGGEALGAIEYHKAWKQWEFAPSNFSAFTWDCLNELSLFLRELNSGMRAIGGGQ